MKYRTRVVVALLVMCGFASGALAEGRYGSSSPDAGELRSREGENALMFGKRYTLHSEYALWENGRSSSMYNKAGRSFSEPKNPIAMFGFSAGSTNSAVHLSSAYDADERQLGVGFSSSSSTLSFIAGEGDSRTSLFRLYGGVDPYLFHGGGDERFSFNSAVFSHAFSEGSGGLIGHVELKSPGLEDRTAWVAGFDTGGYYATYSTINRGARLVADAVGMGYGGRKLGVDYQYIGSTVGAESHRLGLDLFGDRAGRFRVELQSARNPLYAAKDENRLMFTFSAPWGGVATPRLDEEDNANTGQPAGHSRMKTAAIIAGGVVAAAALGSSGSSSKDSAHRFNTQHSAAFDVVNRVNPRSIKENREYGGWIYRNRDGSFASTIPVGGTNDSVNIGRPDSVVPKGSAASASYHTHGAYDPRYLNEQFSDADFAHDRYWNVDGYLGTPAGRMLYHDQSRVYQLGTVAN